MHDVNAQRFASDELGTLLANAFNTASHAGCAIRYEQDDIQRQADAIVGEHLLVIPEVRLDEATVEYVPVGARQPHHGLFTADTLVFNVPFVGRLEHVRAAMADAKETFRTAFRIPGCAEPLKLQLLQADEGGLRVAVERKLHFVPGDRKPDVAEAKVIGKAIRDCVFESLVAMFSHVRLRAGEIHACNGAIRAAVLGYAEKAVAFRAYRDDFRAGIGLPEHVPQADAVVGERGRKIA